jgi:hypothetical protein
MLIQLKRVDQRHCETDNLNICQYRVITLRPVLPTGKYFGRKKSQRGKNLKPNFFADFSKNAPEVAELY